MRRYFYIVFATIFFVAGAYAQDKILDCPTISVEGPAGIIEPGKVGTYSAKIGGNIPPNVRYKWTTSVGEISSGQGTTEIKVRFPDNPNSMTVSLEVEGLEPGCPNGGWETSVGDPPRSKIISAYGPLSMATERIKLKAAADVIRKEPNSQLFVIAYPARSQAKFKRRMAMIKNYLRNTLKVGDQVTFIIGPQLKKETTKIYVVPPGANNPQP